jgi:hypothetical protein
VLSRVSGKHGGCLDLGSVMVVGAWEGFWVVHGFVWRLVVGVWCLTVLV